MLTRLLLPVLATTALLTAPATAAEKPNFVIIIADDLGNADLGYRGGKIKTSNIDSLAKGGARLESYYGLPLCTPARAALMTGRYPMRHGLQTLVIFPSHKYGLPTDERTLPQALKEAGYATYMVGKWHLGHAEKKYWPQNRGFDHFYGNVVGEVDYFTHDRGGVIDWQRNGKFFKEEGYYVDLIGDEAVKLIDGHDRAKPMFLYFASLAPHAPYQAPKADVEAYRDVFADETHRTYAGMITNLDRNVGRVVAALEKKGMRENTVIVFTSDHGDYMGDHGLMLKGPVHYQGLVRIPFIWSDPAAPRQAATSEALSSSIDIARTVLPNGLRVITERMENVRSVSVGVWIGTGAISVMKVDEVKTQPAAASPKSRPKRIRAQ